MNILQNQNLQEEDWKLNCIYLIMQQKQKKKKSAAGVDTSKFAKKIDLENWKSNVDKLDIDKLKNVLNNLSNLKSKVDKLDVD